MKRKIPRLLIRFLVFVFIVTGVIISPVASAEITRNNEFAPSAYLYTNKTMHFAPADPYDGYDIWTFSENGGQQGPTDGFYAMTTDVDTYAQAFGYDEFSTQTNIIAQTWFRPSQLTGAYRFQPILYAYQKTDLTASINWAVSIFWYASNLWLYWNTAHGEDINGELLAAVSPVVLHEYSCLLVNSGNDTWVRIYDYDTSSVIYNGTTTTFNYNASSLYAGFGQYSAGTGDIHGRWDNFTIVDSSLYYEVIPEIYLWGMDVSIIILGLIMIPASTIYLAYGIKHDRSSDRLFYGLIIFFVGCGLLIGGIMP